MNPIAEEIKAITEVDKDILMHYGTKRHSGRYPWGSGETPFQRSGDFLSRVQELRKLGITEKEIAAMVGVDSTTELRAYYSIAKNERKSLNYSRAKSLQEDGLGYTEIGKIMGMRESSVRSLLNEVAAARTNKAMETADFLREQIKEKGMIDVGDGVEQELRITRTKLKEALTILEAEGYHVYGGGVPQVTNKGKQTNLQVLCAPDVEHKEIFNYENIKTVNDYISHDDGETFSKAFVYPKSMDSKRIFVRYAEDVGPDGYRGVDKDGVIELRRGVKDLSLGENTYAQVRILIDDKMYAKGMAIYSDDIPDGYDMVVNSNRKKGSPYLSDDPKVEGVFKKIKKDPDNPFGSAIKEKGGQSYYEDENGKKQLSLINKRAEEGDWSEWKDKVPSQFLAKQNIELINRQIDIAIADKQKEYEDICNLNNPTIKKRLLRSFADDCDTTAVHLHAAALPRQKYQVILPINSMKDNEVYAPNYADGEKVALIRYPHGGTFEIPILTVNNKQKYAKDILGNTKDAVGINSNVAGILSGADFDGDTVMVIPCNSPGNKIHITSTPPLKGLKDFDAKMEYPYREGMKMMKTDTTDNTQKEMGMITNLITDMTLKGATQDELTRAVKHSMVVIDAGKHKLDYKRSEEENGIPALKKRYQGYVDEDGKKHSGASTIISRAKGQATVDKKQGSAKIDKETGKIIYKTSENLTYHKGHYEVDDSGKKTWVPEYNKDGTPKIGKRTQKSTQMAETDDAFTLVSDTNNIKEVAYAKYANTMKAMANEARRTMVNTGKIAYSPSAAKIYSAEVKDLEDQLRLSKMNKPRERQAQLMANVTVKAKQQDNPSMTKDEIKKASQQALTEARLTVGAKRNPITISDKQWEAIQAGAISENKLSSILENTDLDALRQRATPRSTSTSLSIAKINRIKSMAANGRTNKEIADALGISVSSVYNTLKPTQ